MKPLWMQTLAWIAAIAVAVMFAVLSPDTPMDLLPHGAGMPR